MKIKDILGHWFVKNVLLAALLIFAFVMGVNLALSMCTRHGQEISVPDFYGMTAQEAVEYGLIDKVEDYGHAPEDDTTREEMQKRLQEVVQHMNDTKSFREQLKLMQSSQKPPADPKEPPHTLQGFLQGFKKGE